jgi:hypothetical protein
LAHQRFDFVNTHVDSRRFGQQKWNKSIYVPSIWVTVGIRPSMKMDSPKFDSKPQSEWVTESQSNTYWIQMWVMEKLSSSSFIPFFDVDGFKTSSKGIIFFCFL